MGSAGASGWLKSVSKQSGRSSQEGVELTQPARIASVANTSSQPRPHAQQHTPPLPIQQQKGFGGQNHETYPAARCGSSGPPGLPSALGTPPQQAGRDAGATSSSQHQQQQQQQQEPEGGGSSKAQKGVRWLPGLRASPAQGAACPTAAPAEARQAAATAAGEASWEPPVERTSSRSAALPASDDPQLDKYLRYLLQEQHPHKFMFYPGWGLSDDGCAAIGDFLRRDTRIKVMTLSGNSISDEGLELIAEGLAHNSSLLSLDLSDNRISSVGAIELAEALHSDKCKLAELLLHNNRISDEGADALAAAVASSSCLKKLKLSGNSISSAQLDVVQHVLKTREYKLSGQRPSTKSRRHMRKVSSGLQFDIELMEGSGSRHNSSSNLLARRSILRLPSGLAVAALVEAKDTLESSIGMQASHLLAELQDKAQHSSQTAAAASQPQPSGGGTPAAGAGAAAAPHHGSLVVLLAIRLACRGYEVVLRTCAPSLADEDEQQQPQQPDRADSTQQGAGSQQLLAHTGLRHTFLRVSQPLPAEDAALASPTVIVDPHFRDQFEVAHSSKRLQEALEALPRVLCLAEARLFHLVDLLCTETAAAFKEARLSLPPWRHTAQVLDNWLSDSFEDITVDPDSSPKALEHALAALCRH